MHTTQRLKLHAYNVPSVANTRDVNKKWMSW